MKLLANPFASSGLPISQSASRGRTVKRCRPAVRLCGLLSLGSFVFVGGQNAQGASSTWSGGWSVGRWDEFNNWNPGAYVGSNNGGVISTLDVGTFNTPIANTWGSSGAPIFIDPDRLIGGISFDLAAGNFFIGSTGGNVLRLSSGGSIQILSTLAATNAVETINAPLNIQSATATYRFANNSASGAGVGAGTLNFGGGITSQGTTVLTLDGSNTNANTISGIIGNGPGTLGITKSGSGMWVLSGNNTYTGPTIIGAGTLSASNIVGSDNNLGNATTPVTLGSESAQAKLSYTGSTADYARGFSIGGTVSSGGGWLNVTSSGQTLTVSSNDVTGAGLFTVGGAGNTTISSNLIQDGGLTKVDTGTLTLSGTGNNYIGDTFVNAGKLLIGAGSKTGAGEVKVQDSGTLGGVGTINGALTVRSGGTHSPGNSPGTQNVIGAATYDTGSIFTWELAANDTSAANFDRVVGNNSGVLTANGTFNVVLNVESVVLFSNAFWTTNQSWEVFSGFTSVSGLFTLGTVSVDSGGTSYTTPFPGGGFSLRSGASSVYLDWSAVPEPTSGLAGLLIIGGLFRRRR